eukprot:3148618-Rhodomonas_salina.1
MSWGLAHQAAEKAFLARGLDTVSPTTGKYSPQFGGQCSRYRGSWAGGEGVGGVHSAGSS